MEKKTLIGTVAVIVVIILVIWLVGRGGVRNEAAVVNAEGGFAALGVIIPTLEALNGLAYIRQNVPNGGTSLSVSIANPETNEPMCTLGVFRRIDKAELSKPNGENGEWNTVTLLEGSKTKDGMPPQVKIFENFYLIFEPSDATCSVDSSTQQQETVLRRAIWDTLATAQVR